MQHVVIRISGSKKSKTRKTACHSEVERHESRKGEATASLTLLTPDAGPPLQPTQQTMPLQSRHFKPTDDLSGRTKYLLNLRIRRTAKNSAEYVHYYRH